MWIDKGKGRVRIMRGRDHQGLTNMAEDIDTRLSDEQKSKARRTVAHSAARLGMSTDDAAEVMMALGIHPSQNDEDEYLTTPLQIKAGGDGFAPRHVPSSVYSLSNLP